MGMVMDTPIKIKRTLKRLPQKGSLFTFTFAQ
jgi:hypothetical protein